MENMEHNVSHTHSEGHDHSAPKKVENKKNVMMALGAVAIVLIVLAAGNFSGGLFGSKGGSKALTADEAKAKAEDYINKNLVEGTTASIKSIKANSHSQITGLAFILFSLIQSIVAKFIPQPHSSCGCKLQTSVIIDWGFISQCFGGVLYSPKTL